mgnify:CR=1 FL=1
MVNRYITALLVVLAATGMEAQTYQQALKFALMDISYDEFIQQPEAKALEEDILCALKAIKQATEEEDSINRHHLSSATLPAEEHDILTDYQHYIYFIIIRCLFTLYKLFAKIQKISENQQSFLNKCLFSEYIL